MSGFSSSAIILRRMDYSDYDVIVEFFTQKQGRITAVAKNAKKSKKRFAGVLELFSRVEAVFTYPRTRSGLPLVTEVFLTHPFPGIRTDIVKTAYAAYWAEMISRSSEAAARQAGVFTLLHYVLDALDQGREGEDKLSLLFQIRFMSLIGLAPNVGSCCVCQEPIETLLQDRFFFDITGGGVVCKKCRAFSSGGDGKTVLSKGTLKQLLWLQNSELASAGRVHFNVVTGKEALTMMEVFVMYHLSSGIKSLKVLRRIRRETDKP